MKKRSVTILLICLVLVAAVCVAVWLLGKKPIEDKGCTWNEYQRMSLEEQDAFFQQFDSVDEFEAWMEAVNPDKNTSHKVEWRKIGKRPNKYTWEEYQALSAEERDAFYWWFDSADDFEVWMESVKPDESTLPDIEWDKPGKLPEEYAWEEYQALSPEDQEAFYQWFDSVDAFEEWMKTVKSDESITSISNWEKADNLPSEYTWEEYQELSIEEQETFFAWFTSVDAFEEWMEMAKPDESEMPVSNWDKPGKLPNEYTWEEYQALSYEERDSFYQWFTSVNAFEEWMEEAKNGSGLPAINWERTGKLPDMYTWKEYQALTPEEQEAFFWWFDSVENFEAWMTEAMGDGS